MTEYGRLLRHAVQGAWRSRRLLVALIVLLSVMSTLGALLQSRTYLARTLMLLQESDRINPLTREPVAAPLEPIQARMVSLKAILFSDHVLSQIVNRIDHSAPLSGRQLTLKMQELQRALSLDLVGSEVIELRLSGNNPNGLGNQLGIVVETLLQAMMPQEGGTTAAQVLINKQQGRLVAAQQANAALKQEVHQILPEGLSAAREQLAEWESVLTPPGSGRPEAKASPGQPDAAKNPTDLGTGATKPRSKEAGSGCEAQAAALASARVPQPAQLKSNAGAPGLIGCAQVELEFRNLKEKVTRYEGLMERVAASDGEVDAVQNWLREYEIRLRGAAKGPGASILKAPERIRIIDPPHDPDFPSKSRLLYAIVGIMGGFGFSVAVVFCLNYLDSRIFYAEELEDLAKLPIVASLTNSGQAVPDGVNDHDARDETHSLLRQHPWRFWSAGILGGRHRSATRA
jgi:hypothetical protein